LEIARPRRGAQRLVGLAAESEAVSQFTSVRFTERLEEIGATPSIDIVADSFDNALADTINGLHRAERVYGPVTQGSDDVGHLYQGLVSSMRSAIRRKRPSCDLSAVRASAQTPDNLLVVVAAAPAHSRTAHYSIVVPGSQGRTKDGGRKYPLLGRSPFTSIIT